MKDIKKYIAEFIGTMVLVIFGCGTAVFLGVTPQTVLPIAMAFGLTIVVMAYAIGDISGCHVNPAVSLAAFITKRMSLKDFCLYLVSQFLGGIVGAGILAGFVTAIGKDFKITGLGQDGFAASSFHNLSMGGAFGVELVLTFVFVLVILQVTKNEKTSHMAGIVIGLALAFVHILGILLTGTSVNPARSFGPAVLVGGEAIKQVWLFIIAPLIGGALAAFVWMFFYQTKQKN